MPTAPRGELSFRQRDALVVLEVGPQLRGPIAKERRHPQQIPVAGGTVEQQGRRIDSDQGSPDSRIHSGQGSSHVVRIHDDDIIRKGVEISRTFLPKSRSAPAAPVERFVRFGLRYDSLLLIELNPRHAGNASVRRLGGAWLTDCGRRRLLGRIRG
jgi:hypothetical protein